MYFIGHSVLCLYVVSVFQSSLLLQYKINNSCIYLRWLFHFCVQSDSENVPKKVEIRATSRRAIGGLQRSSTVYSEEALAGVDEGPPPRRCRHVDDDGNPPGQLVTKLLEQNARLKNLARQLIADRGQTVAEYLVCLRHLVDQSINQSINQSIKMSTLYCRSIGLKLQVLTGACCDY